MPKVVLIGNSAAGFSCAQQLLRQYPELEITVVSNENTPVYRRDKLFNFLAGRLQEEELFLTAEDAAVAGRVTFFKGSEVVRVEPQKKRLLLKDNTRIHYDYLVVASGTAPVIPTIPGKAKNGVMRLSSLDEFRQAKDRLMIADVVCVVGSAPEASAFWEAVAGRGKEVKIISAPPAQLPQDAHLEWIDNATVAEIIGEGSELKAVKLSNGRVFAASLVLYTGNQIPSTAFLKDTGIATQQGYLVVDAQMQTSIAGIFACGSVACDSSSGHNPHNWDEAVAAGIHAADSICTLLGKGKKEMSADVLVQLGTKGAAAVLAATKDAVASAIKEKGSATAVGFPETNYYLPLINALLKAEVKTLGDCSAVLTQIEDLHNNQPAKDGLFLGALGGILNKGLATLLCEELLAALSYLNKAHPHQGCAGFLSDTLLRSLGIQLVDGRIAGIAVILGPAKDAASAVQLVRDFQSKSVVSILVGAAKGITFSQQLASQNVEVGLDNYIVPLGEDYLSAIYAVNWAVRAPLMYGGLKSGQWEEILRYTQTKVPALVVLLSHVDEVIVATGLGALAMGFPIITDLDVPQLGKIDTTLYEALVTEKDYARLASRCIETRGLKVKVTDIAIPVPYAAAFEGERVRKEQLYVEFGGKASPAFEFLTSKSQAEVEDGAIEVVGPEIDQLPAGKKSLPLAIIVEVYGRKMQKDFEPILERQIHRFVNYCMGLMHVGQRDMNWIRISRDAFAKGMRLKHIGVVLHGMLHQEYSAIVDKVQVKLYTVEDEVERLLVTAKKVFDERDERISGMTDESVDTYYSCLLCQSFAPNHVCIITPERLGLCGAYSWLDAKASFEIMPSGPNQPIEKGAVLEARLGQWENVNEFVRQKSNKSIERVSMYSLLDSPQSSCGCFECIIAIIPEANGVMAVHRDHNGMTPSGMTFTTLAGSVGGGVQTPGFLGVGKLYLTSKKFILAEGGLSRLVWMPKELKELVAEKLKRRAIEIGMPDLIEKIADETVATTAEELMAYLKQVGHPALSLPPLM